MSDEQNPVESALDKLSHAATLPELMDAHREIRRKIRASRRLQSKQFGPLATAYGEMMQLSDKLKADGMPREERIKGIEAVLRATWPFTREWKYLCNECNDTGAVNRVCRPGQRCDGTATRTDTPFQPIGKYQRLCTMSETYEHEYVTPCWCSLGSKFREKPKYDPTDYQEAGQTGKPTRVGRRK